MAFVRGHWRAFGWVRSHLRSPSEPEHEQLPLDTAAPTAAPTAPPVIPAPREPAEPPVETAAVRAGRRRPSRPGRR